MLYLIQFSILNRFKELLLFYIMNKHYYTCHCGKSYKTSGWLEKHQKKCEKRNRTKDKPKKKRISPEMRFKIWEKYIGNKISAKCFCCWDIEITPFTSYNTFQGGHILSEFDGGKIELENLLPICKYCNSAMGTIHWDAFVLLSNYPARLYGGKIPKKTIIKIKRIQLWWKNLKTKKNSIIKDVSVLKGYEMSTYSYSKKCRKKVIKKVKIWH